MNLPNYFLADLPNEASITSELLQDACATLKRNREQYLKDRPVESIIRTLCRVAESWRDSSNPYRQWGLEEGAQKTGFSPEMLVKGLDGFFRQINEGNLERLLEQDLGHSGRPNHWVSVAAEEAHQRMSMVSGPELLVHIASGGLPNPVFTSMMLGFLCRSAQFVKCASGSTFFPRVFAHLIYQEDPKLGACLEVAEWPGGQVDLEDVLFEQANCVTAMGSDETIEKVSRRVKWSVRFLGYGHRVSFGYISQKVATAQEGRDLAHRAAEDVSDWDQLGCLSPHVFYVQCNSPSIAETWADQLAEALDRQQESNPRGKVPMETASTIATRRFFYEVRAAHSPETRQWKSKDSTDWTVIYERDPRFQRSCLHRFIYVKPVASLEEALQGAETVRGKVSTVGLAAAKDEMPDLAQRLARWGVTRICPVGQMQKPPISWRHDGRPALADLMTWTDWER